MMMPHARLNRRRMVWDQLYDLIPALHVVGLCMMLFSTVVAGWVAGDVLMTAALDLTADEQADRLIGGR